MFFGVIFTIIYNMQDELILRLFVAWEYTDDLKIDKTKLIALK